MRVRNFLMVAGMAVALAACSSDDKAMDTGEVTTGQQQAMSATPMDTTGQSATLGGPAAGTQQDLVVNVGDRVFFGYDHYDISSEAQTILKGQADWMAKYPNVNLSIEGHCDERGTREYNLALGERRANSVKNYLTGLGVSANRIHTVSYGKERPAVMGSNAEAWAQNRRAVSVVE
ncbi:MAG: pal [Micavibrio sp.]|nr:pal [Micavibrio sp.]